MGNYTKDLFTNLAQIHSDFSNASSQYVVITEVALDQVLDEFMTPNNATVVISF